MVRIADDHMYEVGRTSCRLQVFARDNASPPVVVATQYYGEGYEPGPRSVMNAPKTVTSAAWRAFLPDYEDPPIFVYRLLPTPDEDDADRPIYGWRTVQFRPGPDLYSLIKAEARGITADQLADLTGQVVDPGRGDGYRKPEPSLTRDIGVFRTIRVARLPESEPFRVTDCMPRRRSWWHDRVRARLRPGSRQPRGCCWYHRGDWHAANALAVETLATAQASIGQDPDGNVMFAAAGILEERAAGWLQEAVYSLVFEPLRLDEDGDWINGQHRGRAMADAGVPRTVVRGVWELDDITLPERFFLDAVDRDLRRRLRRAVASAV